jgi:hypothetical protein
MAYELKDLIVDRVDLVDEGANSAAFIELYKRKETKELMDFKEVLGAMKPEHAAVIQAELDAKDNEVTNAREELDTANQTIATKDEELKEAKEALEKAKEGKEHCECDGEAG